MCRVAEIDRIESDDLASAPKSAIASRAALLALDWTTAASCVGLFRSNSSSLTPYMTENARTRNAPIRAAGGQIASRSFQSANRARTRSTLGVATLFRKSTDA